MADYTTDEIQTAVQQLVLSSIRRQNDSLGVLRTDQSFTDIQQAAAGVFVLYPNAPFYVLALGVKRLSDLITAEVVLLDQLLDALSAVGRKVLPVDDVSTLFNAQAALQELGSAASSRGGVYIDVTKTAAFQRYSTNVQTFLSGPGQAVKENGVIVQTPQQARPAVSSLLSQVQQAHTDLVTRVTGLANGMVDYGTVSLPSVVASSVLSNAANLIGVDANALNVLTPDQRLGSVRAVVLNLLATKAAVQTFGSFSGPSDFYSLDGLGIPFSDAQHLATPAVVTSDFSAAYSIVTGVSDDLHIAADGTAPFDIFLNPSVVAELDGTADDSGFVIGNGTSPVTGGVIPNNNIFKIKVDTTTFVATLALSANSTPAVLTGTGDTSTVGWYGGGGALDGKTLQIFVDGSTPYAVTLVAPTNVSNLLFQINSVTNTGVHGALATNVANRLVFTTNPSIGQSAALLIAAGTALSTLGFTVGESSKGSNNARTADQIAADINLVLPAGVVAEAYYSPLEFSGLMDIPAGVNTTWTLTGGPVADLVALGVQSGDTVHVLSGPNAGFFPITSVTTTSITVLGFTLSQPGALVEIGAVNRKVKVRCTVPVFQVPAETLLTVFGDDAVSKATLNTLGFVSGTFSQCLQTTPDLVANDINSKTTTISAATSVTNTVQSLATAHTDLLDPNHVVFSTASAVGNTVFVGTALTFTVTSLILSGVVSTGDTIALRSGPSPAHGYAITTVNGVSVSNHTLVVGDVIAATGAFAGTSAGGVSVEFGPTLVATKYKVVTVDAPNANTGTYFVSGPGDTAIDVRLIKALPQVRQGVTTSPLTMSASFGVMNLTLSSLNTTTLSELVVQGNAAPLFFTSVPRTQLGTSQWFKLPSLPRGLQAGDILEYYPTNYQLPSLSFTILQVVDGLNAIQVGPDGISKMTVPDGSSWQFTPQPVPFARLRFGTKNNFSQVSVLFKAWLNNSVNQSLFFQNLNRLINPLLVNTNPTADQVSSAISTVKSLYAFLSGVQATAQGQPSAQALDQIVQTFTVESVAAVDALVRSFIEKGSDRAVDLLLQGQFSTFFGMTMDEASYSGAFQSALRDVNRNDLPVRKFNRKEAQTSTLIAQTLSPDMEFTAASVNENLGGAAVDPPTSFGEPSNYGKTTGSSGAGG